jgi:hypothetical protein
MDIKDKMMDLVDAERVTAPEGKRVMVLFEDEGASPVM